MAQQVANDFTSYDLTEEEELMASQFTFEQTMYLQSLLSIHAHLKINLKYDPLNPHLVLQQDAELNGKISILRQLLDVSTIARQTLADRLSQENQTQ